MAKVVELRRHTAAEGDVLTDEGVHAALEIGFGLDGGYELVVSSGAQRATQTAACFLAGLGEKAAGGVIVDARFRSEVEDRWRAAYESAGAGDIASFQKADPELVQKEAELLGPALVEIFDRLSEGDRALVVGHSPMQEVAVFGLTGEIVEPLSKGAGIEVTADEGSYTVRAID